METNPHTLICSRESEGSLWPLSQLDSAPSGLVRSMPTQARSSKSIGRPSRTTETSEMSEESLPTLLQVDFLANHSVLPGSDEARRMTVISGQKCSELYPRQDPLGCLVRTRLASSAWNSTTVFLTWKASVTPSNRLLFRLVPWEPTTNECGFGLLPTLTVNGNYNRKGSSKTSGDGLVTALTRLLPTLTAHDYRGGAKPERTARMRQESSRGTDLATSLRAMFPKTTGIINPSWAEGYMGYPIGWTELDASATPSSRKLRKSSPKQSTNS